MKKFKECTLRISYESHVTSINELDDRFFVLSTSTGEIIYLDRELTMLNSYKLSNTRVDFVFQDKDGGLFYTALDNQLFKISKENKPTYINWQASVGISQLKSHIDQSLYFGLVDHDQFEIVETSNEQDKARSEMMLYKPNHCQGYY